MTSGTRSKILSRCGRRVALAAFVAALAAAEPLRAGYDGTDDRTDVEAVADAGIREQARSVAAIIFDPAAVNRSSRTDIVIREYLQRERLFEQDGFHYPLCPTERFLDQFYGIDCTGFLVAPDVVATAGHCAANAERRALVVLFDLKTNSGGMPYGRTIPRSRMYYAREMAISRSAGENYVIAGTSYQTGGRDWAYLLLDESVCDRPVIARKALSAVVDSQPIYLLGHPQGLPLKHAPGTVANAGLSLGFLASTDAYSGNSGSPVFNGTDHSLEGLYTSGPADLSWNDTDRCWTTKCTTCGAENVLRVTALPDPATVFPGRLRSCPAVPAVPVVPPPPAVKVDEIRPD